MSKTVYKNWSDREILKLIDVVSVCRRNQRVNWEMVKSHFADRTVQQCKSFYLNRVKPFVIIKGQPVEKSTLRRLYLAHVGGTEEPENESPTDRSVRILMQSCYLDIYANVIRMLGGDYSGLNSDLLFAFKKFVEFHKAEMFPLIDGQIAQHGAATVDNVRISREQWEDFVRQIGAAEVNTFVGQVDGYLQTLRE